MFSRLTKILSYHWLAKLSKTTVFLAIELNLWCYRDWIGYELSGAIGRVHETWSILGSVDQESNHSHIAKKSTPGLKLHKIN